MFFKRLGQRQAGFDLLAHPLQHGLGGGPAHVLQHGAQRPVQRLPGAEQGSELLGDGDQFYRLEHAARLARTQQAAALPELQDEQAAPLQLASGVVAVTGVQLALLLAALAVERGVGKGRHLNHHP
ncbi:hypothetical protein D3C81_899040 [compost metagenome]